MTGLTLILAFGMVTISNSPQTRLVMTVVADAPGRSRNAARRLEGSGVLRTGDWRK